MHFSTLIYLFGSHITKDQSDWLETLCDHTLPNNLFLLVYLEKNSNGCNMTKYGKGGEY